jgi:NTE family protein
MKFNLFQDASLASKKTFLKKAREFVKNGFFHFVEQTRYSLFDREKLERVISLLLPDIDIADTTIPFACVATDLTHGKARVFTRGSLRTAVLASAAIPGIFPPVLIDGIYYNDGGAVAVTPVAAAKDLGADFVIASDVKSQVTRWEKPEKAGEIMARCHHITSILLNECHLKEADVILSPQVKLLKWYDFEKIDFLVAEGEQSVARKLWEIRARVQYRRMRNGVRRVGTWLFPGAFAPPDESNE